MNQADDDTDPTDPDADDGEDDDDSDDDDDDSDDEDEGDADDGPYNTSTTNAAGDPPKLPKGTDPLPSGTGGAGKGNMPKGFGGDPKTQAPSEKKTPTSKGKASNLKPLDPNPQNRKPKQGKMVNGSMKSNAHLKKLAKKDGAVARILKENAALRAAAGKSATKKDAAKIAERKALIRNCVALSGGQVDRSTFKAWTTDMLKAFAQAHGPRADRSILRQSQGDDANQRQPFGDSMYLKPVEDAPK
jgi:hypothetical protein